MKSFNKNGILAAGIDWDIKPNDLGSRLGYENGPAAPGMTEEEAKYLLCPFALCHMSQRFPDGNMFFTSVLSRAGGCVFRGEVNGTISIGEVKTFDDVANELLISHFRGAEPNAYGISIPLFPAQAALLFALADALRRRRMVSLLDGRVIDMQFELSDLVREMEISKKKRDPRWLLPFLQNAAGEALLNDDKIISKTLASLCGSSLIADIENGNKIVLTPNGGQLVDVLSRTESFLAASSLFYVEDRQNIMVCLLLGGNEFEFYLELSDEGFLSSCDVAGARAALVTLLAPGDVPGFDTLPVPHKEPEVKSPAKEIPSVNVEFPSVERWNCACGSMNTGAFCPQCGVKKKESVSDGSWLCSCGRSNTGAFCPNCGKKSP